MTGRTRNSEFCFPWGQLLSTYCQHTIQNSKKREFLKQLESGTAIKKHLFFLRISKLSPREILGLNFEKTVYLNFNFPI